MPHKRSHHAKNRRHRRFIEYLQLCRHEMRMVWQNAIWDHDKQEVTNTYPCNWNRIEEGEVLCDSRGQGFLQRAM